MLSGVAHWRRGRRGLRVRRPVRSPRGRTSDRVGIGGVGRCPEFLGAEPVAYGDGLPDRLSPLAPAGVTAAIDQYGTETMQAARELDVPYERITTIAAQVDEITSTNGANAAPGAIEEIACLVAAAQLGVPIPASFPVEQICATVDLQAGRHVHGKVVIDL